MSQRLSEFRFAAVSAEIEQERASALGRIGRRFTAQHFRCHELLADLDRDNEASTRDERVRRYRDERALLEELRWQYIVQREAIGLLDHRVLDRTCPMPERR